MQDNKINISEIKNTLFIIIRKIKELVNDADIYRIICPLCKKDFSSQDEKATNCTVKKGRCCLISSNFL